MNEDSAPGVGFLDATPFVDLLVHAFDHRLTGTLVLEEPDGLRHGVYFEAGTPRRAKMAGGVAPLGEVLVEAGVISEDIHRSTVSRALEQHLLLGQLLLREGFVTEQSLAFGLREQLLRQMLFLFDRPRGTRFGYFDGANLLEGWGAESSARISVMELIWRGLRDHARPEEIQAVLARLGQRPIVLREDMPLDYFFFMGSDRGVVERLRAEPQPLAELVSAAPHRREGVERVVCLLLLTRSVDLGMRSAPPLGVETNVEPSPWSVRPPPLPELPRLFEPDSGARGADDWEAAAVSTPIPVAEPEICDEDEPASDRARAEERARLERELSAAAAFEKAEMLLASGQLERAEAEARFALDAEPGQAEYVALCAWLDVLKPNRDESRVLLDLRRAVRLAEHNVKVHWYRGLVLQHLGRHEYALREFRLVLALDPRHLDAARQVRLYEMRIEQSPKGRPSLAPPPQPSTFGWLRRRK